MVIAQEYRSQRYQADTISRWPLAASECYFDRLLRRKLGCARRIAGGALLLDVGCGNAAHLTILAYRARMAAGIDAMPGFLAASPAMARIHLTRGDAEQLPYANGAFDAVMCFSTLATLANARATVHEIARILKPGGLAALDLGNRWSLGTMVANADRGAVPVTCSGIRNQNRWLAGSRLNVIARTAVQATPLWGTRPIWLRPLLGRPARWLLATRFGGRHCLDDLLAALLPMFATRHLVLCRKDGP